MRRAELELHILPQYFGMPRGTRCEELNKPILVLDGQSQSWKPRVTYKAEEAFVVGTNDKNFGHVCVSLTAKTAYFYEMRVADLSPIKEITGIRKLALNWNNKLSDLEPLRVLTELEALALVNTPNANDLSPVAALKGLRAFEFSGSPTLSSKNKAHTLGAIGTLEQLEELRLQNLTVKRDGLRPLARCKSIKRLVISNTFSTEDFAYLAAKLPNTECHYFSASVPIDGRAIGDGIDTMVVGSRKPFLNSKTDERRLNNYRKKFAELKVRFSDAEFD